MGKNLRVRQPIPFMKMWGNALITCTNRSKPTQGVVTFYCYSKSPPLQGLKTRNLLSNTVLLIRCPSALTGVKSMCQQSSVPCWRHQERIHFFAVLERRSPFACPFRLLVNFSFLQWLAEGRFQLLGLPTFFGSWPASSIFKANNGKLCPSKG